MRALVASLALAAFAVTPAPTLAAPDGAARLLPAQGANELWGFVDREGEWEIPPRYLEASAFRNKVAAVMSGPSTWTLIDDDGDEVLGGLYGQPIFHGALATFTVLEGDDRRNGVVDDTGKILAPATKGAIYTICDREHAVFTRRDDGTAVIGLLTRDGGGFTQPARDLSTPSCFADGRGQVSRRARSKPGRLRVYGYLDARGQLTVEPTFAESRRFSEGLAAAVGADGKWGYIGADGGWRVPASFLDARDFEGGVAAVKLSSGKWRAITPDGASAFGPDRVFNSIQTCGDGLVRTVDAAGKARLQDARTGQILLSNVGSVRAVPGQPLWIVSTRVDGATRHGVIERRGAWRVEPRLGLVTWLGEGRFAYQRPGAKSTDPKGLLDAATGKGLTEPVFTRLEAFEGGAAAAATAEDEGWIGLDGAWIWKSLARRLARGWDAAEALYREDKVDAAIEAFEALADQGYGRAMLSLSVIHRDKKDDPDEADEWEERAFDTGAPAGLHVGAIRRLQQDKATSPEVTGWLERAVAAGHAPAQRDLASLLYEGSYGFPKDSARAKRLLISAADAGDPAATARRGLYELEGSHGFVQNAANGVRLLQASAQTGHADAMYILGQYEEHLTKLGSFGAKQRAIGWYKEAAKRGHADAVERLSELQPATAP